MAIFDFLINKKGLQNQRDSAINYARNAYDPNAFQESLNFAGRKATEGIDQGVEDIARKRTVQELFRPIDYSMFGQSAGRTIATAQNVTESGQRAMAGFESNLAEQDIAAKEAGEQQFAQIRTQQEQVKGQREAAIDEAEMTYEAELSNRRQQLGATALGLAGTVLTTPLGADGSTLASQGLGKIFGEGGEGVAPETSNLVNSLFDTTATASRGGIVSGSNIPDRPFGGNVPTFERASLNNETPQVEDLVATTQPVAQAIPAPREGINTIQPIEDLFGEPVMDVTPTPTTLTAQDIQGRSLNPQETSISDLMDAVSGGTLTIEDIEGINPTIATAVKQRLGLRNFFAPLFSAPQNTGTTDPNNIQTIF